MKNSKITIIIPVFNPDIKFLEESIAIAINNENDLIDRIIIVDDGSKIPVEINFRDFKKISSKIIIIRQGNKGPGGARNTGVIFAQTDIVVFLDHDCRPTKNWIKNLIRPILKNNAVAVGGTVLTYHENNIISEFADFRELLRKPVRNKNLEITNIITASSAFLSDVFKKVGGFDEKLNIAAEDVDFTYKLIKANYRHKLSYAPDSIVFHKHRSKLKDFFKQQYGYGFGSVSHCFYRKRDPREIGFVFPTPLNILKYVFSYGVESIKIIKTIDKRCNFWKRYIFFPSLEYIRKIAILTGGMKAFYNKRSIT